MAEPKDIDPMMQDDYDEDEDSDFDEKVSSASSGGSDDDDKRQNPPKQRRKAARKSQPDDELGDLDSGDEATILEKKKARRKKKRKGEDIDDESEREDRGWKAKTRAMRQREQGERDRRKLASTKGSTLDVDKIFQEMQSFNKACDQGYLQALQTTKDSKPINGTKISASEESDLENRRPEIQSIDPLDSITIKKTYRFAGEVHVEEKVVPRSSEEARTWLAEQPGGSAQLANANGAPLTKTGLPLRRPLRKISRFDPNLNNPESFKKNWETTLTQHRGLSGPKINTVEKSRLDWVDHVSKAGLRDELSEHAKGKGSYMSQRDFLDQVELNREEEARRARLKT